MKHSIFTVANLLTELYKQIGYCDHVIGIVYDDTDKKYHVSFDNGMLNHSLTSEAIDHYIAKSSSTTTFKLAEALRVIAKDNDKHVTAIQFEDGSGFNFNYQLNGSNWKHINIKFINLTEPQD